MRHHVPLLPEPLPDTPLPLVEAWLVQARQAMRNATSMTLATVDPDGRPSARTVICRGFDATAGWFVFYTDRDSPKGRALEAHPRAALVFHWDALERQIRIEGPVTVAPDEDSDQYWNTRPLGADRRHRERSEPAHRLAGGVDDIKAHHAYPVDSEGPPG